MFNIGTHPEPPQSTSHDGNLFYHRQNPTETYCSITINITKEMLHQLACLGAVNGGTRTTGVASFWPATGSRILIAFMSQIKKFQMNIHEKQHKHVTA
jgi:hypothetical protein